MKTDRLDFANQLRGLAALLVAISHLVGVYWALRGYVAAATFSPVQPGATPPVFQLIAWKWFELGPFGVAVFFLISGLVIPFSLRHHTRLTFLLARILRIYPTFIVAIALETLLLYGAAHYWGIPFGYPPRVILFQCLLISDLTGMPIIDFVSWTLSVEIKFYLLTALLVPAIRRGSLLVIFGVAATLAILELALAPYVVPGGSAALAAFCNEAPYIVFMLIGVLFYFHHAGLCSTSRFIAALPAMLLIFAVTWRLGIMRASFTIVAVNYFYAFGLFTVLYTFRRFIRDNRLLGWTADISYPFYLVHPIIGFTVIKFAMMVWHLGFLAALGTAVMLVAVVALILHLTVERYTTRLGRALGRNRHVAEVNAS